MKKSINKSYGQANVKLAARHSAIVSRKKEVNEVSGSDEVILARMMYLKNFLEEKIAMIVPFGHTTAISWKEDRHRLTVVANELVCIRLKGKQTGRIIHIFEDVLEFFEDFSPRAAYKFEVAGRSTRHDGLISFVPEISINIKPGHCDEKIVQRFKTALAKLANIIEKSD